MDRHPKALALGLFSALALFGPARVAAQSGDSADPAALEEARQIFAEGLAQVDRHEWHRAVASFRQVMEIRAAPPVLYNLAIALTEIGEYPEAGDLLAQVLASEETTDELRAQAGALQGDLAARAGRVSITFQGDTTGLVFFIDDYPLGPEAAAELHFVTPGTHVLSVRRGGDVLARREVEASLGRDLAVELAPPEVAPATPAVVEPPPPLEAPTRRPLARNPWLWTGVGVGVAVIVTVIAVSVTRDGNTQAPFTGNLSPGRITW
jgi:hypothetical protein